jgi:hypothetical protein
MGRIAHAGSSGSGNISSAAAGVPRPKVSELPLWVNLRPRLLCFVMAASGGKASLPRVVQRSCSE